MANIDLVELLHREKKVAIGLKVKKRTEDTLRLFGQGSASMGVENLLIFLKPEIDKLIARYDLKKSS